MPNANLSKRFGITDEQFWSMIEPEGDPCDCRLWLGEWTPSGHSVFRWAKRGPLIGTVYHMPAYHIAFQYSPNFEHEGRYEGQYDGKHISHLCGLAPCCNPHHLFRIPASQNSKDAWAHRRIFEETSHTLKHLIQALGTGFKEAAKEFDIPPGVAFRLIHGKLERGNYPAPFVNDLDLPRQPVPWYVKQLARDEEKRLRLLKAEAERPKDFSLGPWGDS